MITKPEQYAEYPINNIGLKHLHDAFQAGRIKHGFVVLACWYGHELTVAGTKSVQEVIDTLADIPPPTGRYGEYWWLRADFTPDGPRVLSTVEEF